MTKKAKPAPIVGAQLKHQTRPSLPRSLTQHPSPSTEAKTTKPPVTSRKGIPSLSSMPPPMLELEDFTGRIPSAHSQARHNLRRDKELKTNTDKRIDSVQDC